MDPEKGKKKETKKEIKKETQTELSEEDKALKEGLELCVLRLSDVELGIRLNAVNQLKKEIKSSTSTITSVPKPFKFLKDHFKNIKKVFEMLPNNDQSKLEISDVIAILCTSLDPEECLKYTLQGTRKELETWGLEYFRTLTSNIGKLYADQLKTNTNPDLSEVKFIIDIIVPYFMHNNAEAEAVDFMLEIENIEYLINFTTFHNYEKVCSYLCACSYYSSDADEFTKSLSLCYKIYMHHQAFPNALRIALKLNNTDLIREVCRACKDKSTLMQMSYMMAKHQIPYNFEDEELNQILANSYLSKHYLSVGKDLDVLGPKNPEDIFKTHLEEKKGTLNQEFDSLKTNLAWTYVNGFVNAGFCQDNVISKDIASWLAKNKDQGVVSAVASLGLINLWDIDGSMSKLDKLQYTKDDFVTAGAYLGLGISNCNIRSEHDPALAILSEQLNSTKQVIKDSAIMGLGFAYVGTCKQEILDSLSLIVLDTSIQIQTSALAALSLGIVYVGSSNPDVSNLIVQAITDRDPSQFDSPFTKIFLLSLGLVFMGQQDKIDTILLAIEIFPPSILKMQKIILIMCAYAGSGNVLKIQELLHFCAEKVEEKENDYLSLAVLGVATIALGEKVGTEMALKTLSHLFQYGDKRAKMAVPLAIGLLNISNPLISIMDSLNKLSYDTEPEVAINSLFALGLVGAGTNMTRLADILRRMAAYYYKDQDQIWVIRIAQGLLHMGKGLITLNPVYSDNFLVNNTSLCGLLITLVAFTEQKKLILSNYHYFLYYLVLAMKGRFLITLNEKNELDPVLIRVGQAVDIIGQAGHPKSITGFQTHNSPVLIATGERGELGIEDKISLSPVLEDIIILKNNSDYKPEKK